MKRALFVLLFLGFFAFSSDAIAQSTDPLNDNTPDPCPTYESCTVDTTWWKPWTWWQQPPDPPCPPKGETCESCKANCDCEFGKAKNKCNNGLLCIERAQAERNACVGGCYNDTLDVC